MTHRTFYVYIVASRSRRLYTGITRDLARRLWQHRSEPSTHAFTTRYRIHRLVYYETTANAGAAIAREKQIKAWSRAKRVELIERENAGWDDLAASWFPLREVE